MTDEWVTVRELAEQHDFHRSTVTRWILAGELEAYRVGRREWRIRRSTWNAYLDSRRFTAMRPTPTAA